MVTLSAPCRALMDSEPLTARLDDLVSDVSAQITGVDYRAAVAVDGAHRPVGVVTHAELVSPEPRRVLLVDHAEQAQSVIGVEHAEIVEILDHHHVGSIETTVPVLATFDPVGSTATLVVERFRTNGMEPTRSTAIALLGAVQSDTVILNSPTTTERDHAAVEYLERVLALDATQFGREMFETTSDVSEVDAEAIVTRDAKEYAVGDGQKLVIAQIETVGDGVLARRDELLDELQELREARGAVLYALMVTDIMAKGTKMLVAGEHGPLERVFGQPVVDGTIDLPGVMSRQEAGRAEAAGGAVGRSARRDRGRARGRGGPVGPRLGVAPGRPDDHGDGGAEDRHHQQPAAALGLRLGLAERGPSRLDQPGRRLPDARVQRFVRDRLLGRQPPRAPVCAAGAAARGGEVLVDGVVLQQSEDDGGRLGACH
jgi:inorganic pyrophosphatase/exopolyphosphatase